MNRRTFIGSAAAALGPRQRAGQSAAQGVSIVTDTADPIAQAGPAVWAARELEQALASRDVMVFRCARLADAKPGDLCIVAAASDSVPAIPEALALMPSASGNRKILSAFGHDSRGLTYALLELSDRVRHADDPMAALAAVKTTSERPANAVRGMARLFTSDVENKPCTTIARCGRRI